MKILLIGLSLMTTVLHVTSAQQSANNHVTFFSKTQVDSIANSKITPDKPGRLLAISAEKESYLVVVRVKEGAVEAHELFDDVAVIRSGNGVLRIGDEVKGAKVTGGKGQREWIGGTISNPRDRKVKAGDFLVIPAKLPHQYIPEQGDSLVYFTIKVKHP